MRRRLSTLTLWMVLCSLLVGCSLSTDDKLSVHVRQQPVQNGFVLTAVPEADFVTPRDQAILEQMKLVLENDLLALYLGEYHDLGLLDKRTGKLLLSGDSLYSPEGKLVKNNTYRFAASQLHIEYYDRQNLFRTKSTYPDCYLDKGIQQVFVEKDADKVTVTYELGQRNDQYIIPFVLTGEAYSEIRARMDALVKEGKLTKSAVNQFSRSYKKITFSSLSEKDKDEVRRKYANIDQLNVIHMVLPNLTNKIKGVITSVSLTLGIDADYIQEQIEQIGVADTDTSSVFAQEADYFRIPVEYRLEGADLIAHVSKKDITMSPNTYLTRVFLLNSFAANRSSEPGYIFLPDGSGSIIDNQASVYGMTEVELDFYGQDFGITYDSFERLAPFSAMPVFGIKGADAALFGIVENGDAMAGVRGSVAVPTYAYAGAGPYFHYYKRDYLNRTASVYAYSNILPTEDFAVRYHILYGDDNNYSGMARYYQAYLEQQGIITRQAEAADIRLNLRLFAAINKVQSVMGVPVKRVLATTTFSQARQMLDALHQSGIQGADIIYTEMINGAREPKAPSRFAIEKPVGDAAGYQALVSHAESLGYRIHPGVDFGRIMKQGNGIGRDEDLILRISRDKAVVYNGIRLQRGETAPMFVSPLKYRDLAGSFIEAYRKVEGDGLYLMTLGSFLSGNYNDKAGLTRAESQQLTIDLMEMLANQGLRMKMDAGAAYALRYADSLINAPLGSSEPRLEKHAVPFVAMVLKGYVPFAGSPINNSDDYERSLLRTLENGADLYYEIMGEEPFILADTEYTDMYSVNASLWLDDIMAQHRLLREQLKGLANERIRSHRQLHTDVFETLYENGTRVIVNYADSPWLQDGRRVDALSYLVLPPAQGKGASL